jgi:nucleoside phosphorylase
LIVAAVRQEVAPFLAKANGAGDLLLTGIGTRRAYSAVRDRLRRGGVDWVLSAGFSGATRAGMRVGDLISPSEVIDASTRRGWVPSWTSRQIGSVTVGATVTADRLLVTPAAKEQAGRAFNAVAVDMEVAAVARAAQEMGIPWAAVRVILDPMEMSLRWWNVFPLINGIRVAGRSLAAGLERLVAERRNDGSGEDGISH